MADQEEINDIHGFFQFADVSDSDDEDSLFGKTRDRTVVFDASKINYTPKLDEDQWFDKEERLGFDGWFHSHSGLDEITFTVQRLYFKRSFPRVVGLCERATKAYVEKNKNNLRVANIRELLEIGANAAMEIDDLESTEFFYSWYQQCGSTYPGFNNFQASVLAKLGRLDEALDQYVQYLVLRKQDARIWELIGLLLVRIGQKSEGGSSAGSAWLRLALGAFYRAYSIIRDCKNWKDIDLAVRRKRIQVDELKDHAIGVLREAAGEQEMQAGSEEEEDSFWQHCLTEGSLNEQTAQKLIDSCQGKLRAPASWIVAQLSKREIGEADACDEESEKNVADL